MKIERWLVISKPRSAYSSISSVKLATKKPSVSSNQIAVKFEIDVPYEVWDTNRFEAKLNIDKDLVKKVRMETNVKLINI